MGIPVYFKTLVQDYHTDILQSVAESEPLDTLCIDLNCLIHPCCRKVTHQEESTDESRMRQVIIESLDSLIEITGVSNTLYIAIDGVAPKAKMKQQRQRRYKSIYEQKPWDTNAISPGTHFMTSLHECLREWISNKDAKVVQNPLHIILSDSNEPGEGEHKIVRYLKEHGTQNRLPTAKCAIYGLDADLIMLGLVVNQPSLYLLRERTEYNIEGCDDDYIYLHIDHLKSHILTELEMDSRGNKDSCDRYIHDYIFLCFFLGNDFINHNHTLSLRYKGLSYLLQTYKKLQQRYQGYFQLVDIHSETIIHMTFFKEFVKELSLQESRILDTTRMIRSKQSTKLKIKYRDEYNMWTQFCQTHKSTPTSTSTSTHIPYEMIHEFQTSYPHDTYKEMIQSLPLFYDSPNVHDAQASAQAPTNHVLCQDYMDSLVWTAHYYFKGCSDWSWCTQTHLSPTLKDFSQWLHKETPHISHTISEPWSISQQLSYIFPPQSHSLHSHPINSKSQSNPQLVVDVQGCRYLWEAPLIG